MKNVLLYTVMMLFCLGMVYGALSDNLEMYYTLDQTTGNATDSTINNIVMEEIGTVASADGILNYSRGAYSDANYFERDNDLALNGLENQSWSVWVNFSSGSDGTRQYIVGTGEEVTGEWGFYCMLDGDGDDLMFFAWDLDTGCTDAGNTWNTDWTISTDVWYHIVFTRDADTYNNSVYINGALNYSWTDSSSCDGTDATKLRIGRSSAYSYGLTSGVLDEYGFWSKTLSDDEVSWTYECGMNGVNLSACGDNRMFMCGIGENVTYTIYNSSQYPNISFCFYANFLMPYDMDLYAYDENFSQIYGSDGFPVNSGLPYDKEYITNPYSMASLDTFFTLQNTTKTIYWRAVVYDNLSTEYWSPYIKHIYDFSEEPLCVNVSTDMMDITIPSVNGTVYNGFIAGQIMVNTSSQTCYLATDLFYGIKENDTWDSLEIDIPNALNYFDFNFTGVPSGNYTIFASLFFPNSSQIYNYTDYRTIIYEVPVTPPEEEISIGEAVSNVNNSLINMIVVFIVIGIVLSLGTGFVYTTGMLKDEWLLRVTAIALIGIAIIILILSINMLNIL